MLDLSEHLLLFNFGNIQVPSWQDVIFFYFGQCLNVGNIKDKVVFGRTFGIEQCSDLQSRDSSQLRWFCDDPGAMRPADVCLD